MTKRIDHAQEAREWLKGAERLDVTAEMGANLATIGQVHATLALVEQQRITNVLALNRHEVEWDVAGNRSYLYEPGTENVLPEIKEALGLA